MRPRLEMLAALRSRLEMLAALLLALGLLDAFVPAGVAGAQEPAATPTRRVRVTVVEVAGGRAYLAPGGDEGLRRGDRVVIAKRRYKVVAVSAQHAVVEQRDGAPAAGDKGSARVREMAGDQATRLPAPSPLDGHRGQWPRARAPALDQTPHRVPLGPTRQASQVALWLSSSATGVVPLSGDADPIGRGQLRGRLRYEPLATLPLTFDADVAGRLWVAGDLSGRAGSDARFPLFVRELRLGYGRPRDWYAGLGRLRHASATLGMLDGTRLSAPLGAGLTLAAFGGAVPDPLDGGPSLDASRFGGELAWEDTELAWRPRVSIGGHGSYFDDALDERRLNGMLDLYPDFGQLGGHVEVSLLDGDNPWNAPSTQVSAAGLDTRLDLGVLELGARAGLHRPERSRWLASFLPPEWLCAPRADSDPAAGDSCAGDELYYGGGVDTRFAGERLSFTLGVSADDSRRLDARQLGAFAHLRVLRLFEVLRVDSSLHYTHGSLSRGGRALLGLGAELAGGALDVAVHYQPAYLTYTADVGYYVEHGAGASLVVLPDADLDISLLADFITGRDLDLLTLQTLLNYRPAP